MKKNNNLEGDALLNAYSKALNDNCFFYLTKLSYANIHKCLLELLNGGENSEDLSRYIIGYFGIKLDIKSNDLMIKKINEKELKEYKSISDYLKKGTNSKKSFTKNLANCLVKFDIDKALKIKKDLEEKLPKIQNPQAANLKAALRNTYKTNLAFTTITINGDVDKKLGEISMEDYYVQSSYISTKEISHRENLVHLEKEQASIKLTSRFAANYAQDYINKTVISSNKVVIIGNPGIGKSVYAKWLCYNWSKTPEEYNYIPIYIPLRELDFEKDFFLESYIKNNYIENSAESIKFDLNQFAPYQLILDGFDELDSEYQRKLLLQIKKQNYILLSRPYGLIEHTIENDISIQIDGFNTASVKNYLFKILKKEEDVLLLMDIIGNNQVLLDYSSTPLILSYICLIYVGGRENVKTLTSITSLYNLQEKVLDWVLGYNRRKPNLEIKEINADMKRVEAFAFDMLISKNFVYIGSYDDENYKTACFLSKLGLGSTRTSTHDTKWKFSFNTVTFQEFLAARYMITLKLNIDSFIYLVTDNYFWNFCLLLVGGLSTIRKKHKNDGFVGNMLENIKEKIGGHSFYGNTYYMLLAECNSQQVQEIIGKDELSTLVANYKNSYFDYYWESSLRAALNKIIYKLDDRLRDYFVSLVKNSIENLPKDHNCEETYGEDVLHLSSLINITLTYEETKVTSCVVSNLYGLKDCISYWSEYAAEKENYFDENEEQEISEKEQTLYDNCINNENWGRYALMVLFTELYTVSETALIEHEQKIRSIFREELTNIQVFEKIILKINDFEDLRMIDLSLKTLKQSLMSGKFKQQDDLVDELIHIAEKVYCNLLKINESSEVLPYEANGLYLAKFCLRKSFQDTDGAFFKEYYLDVITEILMKIGTEKCINLLFEIIEEYQVYGKPYKGNLDTLKRSVLALINDAVLDSTDSKIEKIIAIINFTGSIDFFFIEFRDSLYNLLQSALKNDRLNTDDAINLTPRIIRLFKTPHDKKYLIDSILRDDEMNSISQNILKYGFVDFTFYEKKYWQILIPILKLNDTSNEIKIAILSNEELYVFNSNHEYLNQIFCEVLQSINTEEIVEYSYELLPIIAQQLIVIKDTNPTDKNKILNMVKDILNNNSIKKLCSYKVEDLSDVNNLIAYILYYQYDDFFKDFFIDINIFSRIEDEPSAISMLFDSLISFSVNKNYGIEMQEIEKYEEIFGGKLYKELIDLISQRLLNNNSYDKDHLKILLEL